MASLSKGSIIYHVTEAMFEVNRASWLTIRDLFLRPEKVIESYLNKDTDFAYINPFRYAFLLVSLYVAMSTFAHFDFATVLAEVEPDMDPSFTYMADILHNASAFLMFVSIAPAAWLMKKVFPTSHKTSSDCYIILLFSNAQIMLVIVGFFLPLAYFTQERQILDYSFFLTLPYVIWMAKRVFDYSWISTTWRSLMPHFFYTFVQLVFVFTIAIGTGIQKSYDEHNEKSEVEMTTSEEEKKP
jgi:hypothetical protein